MFVIIANEAKKCLVSVCKLKLKLVPKTSVNNNNLAGLNFHSQVSAKQHASL